MRLAVDATGVVNGRFAIRGRYSDIHLLGACLRYAHHEPGAQRNIAKGLPGTAPLPGRAQAAFAIVLRGRVTRSVVLRHGELRQDDRTSLAGGRRRALTLN